MAYVIKNELEQLPDLQDHSFLGELLLQPFVNQTDGSRSMMFTSNIPQMLELDNPEKPLLFTRFENQIGEHSRGLKKTNCTFEVDMVIDRNGFEIYNLGYNVESDLIDVIVQQKSMTLTESYSIHNTIIPFEESSVIPKGTVYQYSNNFDEYGNLQYGINVKTAFLPYKGLTFEDAIVISESLQERMSHTYSHTVRISLNNNDVLTSGLPKVGDIITNGVLGIRRRISYVSGLAALSNSAFKEELIPDTVFKCSGEVVDIKIFSNTTIEKLAENEFNKEIVEQLSEQTHFYTQLKESLQPIIDEGGYSDEVANLYLEACHFVDPDYTWTFENSEFDSLLIEIRVNKRAKVTKGSKISGRVGNKGVVSLILPDDEMPMDFNGNRVDACQNPGGVPNRLNISQVSEMEVLHMSAYFIRKFKDQTGLDFINSYLTNFLDRVNKKQADEYRSFVNNLSASEVNQLSDEIKDKGFHIEQPPFFGNIKYTVLADFYNEGHGHPQPIIYPDGSKSTLPVMVSDMYLTKLKHESSSKFSARSAQYVGIKNVPTKNNRDFKSFQASYSNTPVRIGEQELFNLFLSMDFDSTFEYIRMMSSNRKNRHQLIETFLSNPNVETTEDIDLDKSPSLTSLVFRSYLEAAGLQLVE